MRGFSAWNRLMSSATPAAQHERRSATYPDRLLRDHQRHQARHLLRGSRAHPRRRRPPAQSHRSCAHRIGGSGPFEGAPPRQTRIWSRRPPRPQQLLRRPRRSLARGPGAARAVGRDEEELSRRSPAPTEATVRALLARRDHHGSRRVVPQIGERSVLLSRAPLANRPQPAVRLCAPTRCDPAESWRRSATGA